MSVKASASLCKHPFDVDTYYADFSSLIGSRTISAVDEVTCSDSTIGITGEAVQTSSTTVDSVTLEASKAIRFTISGGTEQTGSAVVACEITAKVTLSDGSIKALVCPLLVEA